MRVEIYGDANQKTVSGPTVQFTADDAAPVTDLKAQITPSIAGHSSVTITANGQNTRVSLTKPVYGGAVDVTTGVVTETHGGGAYNPTEVPTDLSSKIVSATTERPASGSVASFKCSLGEYPMSALTAAINPVQDLHGYEHPWPGGGGKNKFYTSLTIGSLVKNGLTFTVQEDGQINVSGTATANTFQSIGYFTPQNGVSYILNGCPNGGSTSTYRMALLTVGYDIGNGLTFIGAGTRLGISIDVYNGQTVNLMFKPMIRLASDSDPTFTPYSNICPISGWTGVSVYRTGKNLLDVESRTIVTSYASQGDSTIYTESCTATKSGDVLSVTITGAWSKLWFINSAWHFKHGNTYTISAYFDNPGGNKVGICYLKLGISSSEWTTSSIVQTSGKVSLSFTYDDSWGDMVIAFIVNNTNSSTNNSVTVSEMMIELGSTATTYEPYNGTTYAVDWTSQAGTVYGGTLDVVTGVLTVTHGFVTISDFNNPTSGTSAGGLHWADTSATIGATQSRNSWCSMLTRKDGVSGWGATSPCYAFNNNGSARIYITETTKAAMESAYADLEIVYPFVTPQTYQLTPQEVIKTLLGTNNVWADTGNVTVSYRDGLLSNVSGIMTNSTALTAGENITYTLSQERTFQIPGTVIRTVVGNNVMSASTGNISVTWSSHWFDITPWIAYQGLTFSRNDVDAPDAGRDMSGYMHRGRVGVKEKMNVTTVQLTRAQSSKLQTLLYPETIQVRVTPYPRTNTSHTMSMYTNNVKTTYVIHRENGEDLQSLTFPLIEN